MSGTAGRAKFASVSLQTHNQNAENIHRVVDRILGMAGCPSCGLLASFHMDFVVDPPEELKAAGVTGLTVGGLQER